MGTILGTVIAAAITGGLSLLGVVFTNKTNNQKMLLEIQKSQQQSDAKREKEQAITDTKIDELTREVRIHNGFAQKIPVIEEQIKAINHRLDDLEEK
jgi:hypothetical protein